MLPTKTKALFNVVFHRKGDFCRRKTHFLTMTRFFRDIQHNINCFHNMREFVTVKRLNFDTILWLVETIFEIPGWAIRMNQVCFAMTSTVTNIKRSKITIKTH
jgi:hypothetical protein